MNFRVVLICFLQIVIITAIQGKEVRYKHFDIKSGIPSNEINCIEQCSEGYMWIGTSKGFARYDGYSFINFKSEDLPGMPDDYISAIIEFDEKTLLLGTYRSGVLLFDKEHFSIQQIPLELFPKGRNFHYVTSIVKKDTNTVWVGTAEGLLKLIRKGDRWEVKDYMYVLASVKRKNITTLYLDSVGLLWMATQNEGVLSYDDKQDEIRHYVRENDSHEYKTQSINVFTEIDGRLICGGYRSLIWYDRENDEFVYIETKGKLFNVNSIFKQGESVWLGLKEIGLVELEKGFDYDGINEYILHTPYIEGNQLSHVLDDISDIYVDPGGYVWCGTSYNGIVRVKNVQAMYSDVLFSDLDNGKLIEKNVNCLNVIDDQIWAGTSNGLYFMDLKKVNGCFFLTQLKNTIHFLGPQSDSTFFVATGKKLLILNKKEEIVFRYIHDKKGNEGVIWSAYQYASNAIYLGTYGGVFVLNPIDYSVQKLPIDFNMNKVWLIKSDHQGNVWFAAFKSGVARYHPDTGEVKYFNEHNECLLSDEVNTMYCGADSTIWLGTKLGLMYYKDGKFCEEEIPGLPGKEIRSVIEKDSLMWLGQKNGVVVYDRYAKSIQLYPIAGRTSLFKNFMSDGAVLDAENKMYIISYKNVKRLSVPLSTRLDRKLMVTDFLVNNKRIIPSQRYNGNIILDKDINEVEKVVLSYNENNIAISLSGLDFLSEDGYYAYKFQDDEKWNYLSHGKNTINYLRLSPGRYNLQFRRYSSLSSSLIAEKDLTILIKHHFMLSPFAIGLYVLVVLLILYTILYIVRLKQKAILEQERQDQRLNFYTDMSHETRTPLTLVIESARSLMQNKVFEKVPEVKYIYNNASRLMQLMDRVLEIRKIETDYAGLDLVKCNVGELLENYCATFKSEMQHRKQDYSFTNLLGITEAYIDPFKAERIIYNLMSNATKYTPVEGSISVHIDAGDNQSGIGKYMQVSVSNSGPGIMKQDIPHVFKRYYCKNNSQFVKSSGVGLDLTSKLVRLHGGDIQVVSIPDEITTFTFTLCVDKDQLIQKGYPVREIADLEVNKEKLYDISPVDSESIKPHAKSIETKVRILVVEDNAELLKFMSDMLKPLGIVDTATNGKDAYELIETYKPSLIISDLMMPVMDGAELCRKVKNDIRYRHIPFILLTASHSEQAQLEVYQAGAEDFVTKPFNSEMLMVRIKRMLENSVLLNDQMQEWAVVKKGIIEEEKKASESAFEKQVRSIVVDNLADPEFDVNTLTNKMKMGKTSFYNKLKEVTGKAPIEYINYYKLLKSKEDLLSGRFTVSEVAYNYGYSDPSYFARVFKKEFGCTPTQYLKSISSDDSNE